VLRRHKSDEKARETHVCSVELDLVLVHDVAEELLAARRLRPVHRVGAVGTRLRLITRPNQTRNSTLAPGSTAGHKQAELRFRLRSAN